MPFTVEEFRDLVRILEEKPEWRAELRRLILTEELLSLPEQVAALRAETERRFQEMAAEISRLSAAVAKLDAAVARLGSGWAIWSRHRSASSSMSPTSRGKGWSAATAKGRPHILAD